MKNKPDYIVLGAAKSGTTSMCNYLGLHPNVYMTKPKELDFFGRERIEEKLDVYETYFSESNKKIKGEGSVSYMLYSELAAKQIKAYLPQVKLIMMLRNPADRFISDFWFNINRGAIIYQKGLLEAVINNTIEVPYSSVHKMTYRESLVTKGMYAQHLKNYLDYFDLNQIKIVFFEDFKKDRNGVLKEVFEFIGANNIEVTAPEKVYNKTQYPGKFNFIYVAWKRVKPYFPQNFVQRNRSKLVSLKEFLFSDKKPEIKLELRDKLVQLYLNDISELEQLIQKDLSHWKK